MYIPFLGTQKVFTVRKQHVLDARLEHDRAHWALLTCTIPSPTPIGAVRRLLDLCRHSRGNDYVSAMKMCTRCSASFSYSFLASRTSLLRISLFRATTLSNDERPGRKSDNLVSKPNLELASMAVVGVSLGPRYLLHSPFGQLPEYRWK